MRRVETWSRDKPRGLRELAVGLAEVSWEVWDALMLLGEKPRGAWAAGRSSPEGWLRLYSAPERVLEGLWTVAGLALAEAPGALDAFGDAVTGYIGSLRAEPKHKTVGLGRIVHALSDAQLVELQEAWACKLEELRAIGKAMAAEVLEEPAPEPDEEKLFLSPEVQFALRVWLPCWVLTGRFVSELYEKAQGGDRDALSMLLRIDPAVVSDARIAQTLLDAAHGNGSLLADIARAMAVGVRVDRRQVKFRFAGLISAMSGVFGRQLTAGEIRGLFDAVAIDLGKDDGDEGDPDLRQDRRGLQKAIQEARDELALPDVWRFLMGVKKVRIGETKA